MTSTDDGRDDDRDDDRDRAAEGAVGLADGSYDAFVIWADERADGSISIELTVTAGVHKGDVVGVVAWGTRGRDPLGLVGLPCTLVVDGGRPRVDFDGPVTPGGVDHGPPGRE